MTAAPVYPADRPSGSAPGLGPHRWFRGCTQVKLARSSSPLPLRVSERRTSRTGPTWRSAVLLAWQRGDRPIESARGGAAAELDACSGAWPGHRWGDAGAARDALVAGGSDT